jgi:hypothetical protein
MHDRAVRHVVIAIFFTAALVVPSRSRAGHYDMSGVGGFEQFAEEHPATASQLARNPALFHDPDWMRHHATLQVFLHDHPMAGEEFDDAPETTPDPGEPAPESLSEKKPKRYESPLVSPLQHVEAPSVVHHVDRHPEAQDED